MSVCLLEAQAGNFPQIPPRLRRRPVSPYFRSQFPVWHLWKTLLHEGGGDLWASGTGFACPNFTQQQTPFLYSPMSFSLRFTTSSFISSSCLGLSPSQHLSSSVVRKNKVNQPLLPSAWHWQSGLLSMGLVPSAPHTQRSCFPMVAAGQRGSSTCAIGVVLCKSTGEFRPVSINLLS